MATFITFPASGAGGIGLVTSAFYIERGNRAVGCFVSSYGTAAGVTVQVATSSGGTFLPLNRSDGSGLPFIITSGTGGGAAVVEWAGAPWLRLAISSAQVSVTSVQIEAVLR